MELRVVSLFSVTLGLLLLWFVGSAEALERNQYRSSSTTTATSTAMESSSATRFAIDYSLRVNMNQVSDHSSQLQFIGFDFFRNFSLNGRDIGVLLIQPYLIKASRLRPFPGLFDGPDDTALQFRNVYFRFTPLFDGRAQISVGHVELPYGLEREYETNATLRQFGNAIDGGQKVDWGVVIDGYTANLKYDVSLTRGSGNEWRNEGQPYLFTARVGTRFDNWYSFGLTVARGDLWSPTGNTSERQRVALDGRVDYHYWALLGQYSQGKNNDISAKRGFIEVNWNYGYDEWLVYAQKVSFELSSKSENQTTTSIGLRFEPNNKWAFKMDYTRDSSNFGKPNRKLLRDQFRIRI